MIRSFSELIPMIPECFVTLMVCITLLTSLFFGNRFKNISYYLAQFTLLIALLLTVFLFSAYDNQIQWLTFEGAFVFDKLAVILKLFIYLSVFFTFLYSRQYNQDRHIPMNEFHVLGLLSVIGMMVLVSGHSLLTLFLGLELLSLPIYAMIALQRGQSRCIESAMKYFVIGSMATGMMLYGISIIFGTTKALDIAKIATFIVSMHAGQHLIFIFALVFLLVGIAFKLGAAPFHMWAPDVYDGAPSSVTLFLATAPKIAAFGLVIRLLVEAMPALHVQWQEVWIVVALLSMAIGNLAAIVQSNIKRLLAYSSIAHMGYMILGLICATPQGNAAALFYMISYVIMTLGAFGMIILVSSAGYDANRIEDFSGLNERNPWFAFLMLIILFSLAGIPPLLGFIAKLSVLESLIKVHLVWLAVAAILFAVIGAYYYIRLVKIMYFEKAPENLKPIQYSFGMNLALSVNSLAVLILGVFPGALFSLSHLVF